MLQAVKEGELYVSTSHSRSNTYLVTKETWYFLFVLSSLSTNSRAERNFLLQ